MHLFHELTSIYLGIDHLQDKKWMGKKINLSILRLDKIHPVVSGNKLFKLHHFMDEATSSSHKTIVTFGGAWSNHLAATAYACKKEDVRSIGIVRGEEPAIWSDTLIFCRQAGMDLQFISRDLYQNSNSESFKIMLAEKYGEHTLIPEGGFSIEGARGAEGITDFFSSKSYTHICCSTGTATTFAGLINGSPENTTVVGFSALKNMTDIPERLRTLNVDLAKKYDFIGDYHFGGYAKKTNELIVFINNFYEDNKIPLDFVYTGKMMFGVIDLINKNYFEAGSNILCVHTGGLQGNQSLPRGTLNF